MDDLVVGQKLWCRNGETVAIKDISDNEIHVVYRGVVHARPKSVVGYKLFVSQLHAQAANQPQDDNKAPEQSYAQKLRASSLDGQEAFSSCSNCMVNKRGDCFGAVHVCADFMPVPTVDREIQDAWPAYGDATRFRRKGRCK